MDNTGLSIEKINFTYDSSELFSDFSMEFPDSGVSVILGPSGCGKTTLLNLICGLLQPHSGRIIRNGAAPSEGNISVIFQEPRLLPWRSVRRNIEIMLKHHYSADECRKKADHYLELVELGNFRDFFPHQLSGGMRQRAALARAFAYPADMILMDEPFQALDLGLKINLTKLFTGLWIDDRRTSIFVTHDINEAILLGDEIFVLSASRPVKIVEHLRNTEPHSARSPDSEESIKIEKILYRKFTGASSV